MRYLLPVVPNVLRANRYLNGHQRHLTELKALFSNSAYPGHESNALTYARHVILLIFVSFLTACSALHRPKNVAMAAAVGPQMTLSVEIFNGRADDVLIPAYRGK